MKKSFKFLSLTLVFSLLLSTTIFAFSFDEPEYQEAYAYVTESKIMSGTSQDDFNPDGEVNYASVIQTFYNAAGNPELETEKTGDTWYYKAVTWGESIEIIDETFSPDKVINTGDAITAFYNYSKYLGMFLPEDSMDFAVSINLLDEEALAKSSYISRIELAVMHKNYADYLATAKTEGEVLEVDKYGNITLDLISQNLYNSDFEPGDILFIKFDDFNLKAPFGTSYSDVDNGEIVVRAPAQFANVKIAINMGNFAETYNVGAGAKVKLSVLEKQGYGNEYELRQLKRSNEREDYESDEIFANFRMTNLGDIKDNVLYRSSSPVNNDLNRAAYVDEFTKNAGIKTVINLADSEEELNEYFNSEGFNSPYYKQLYDDGKVIYLGMGVDFKAEDFKSKLKTGLDFLIENDGPYLIHCNEGKDRAGYVAALLEALMGATADEIKEDYMISYMNYYNVEKGSEQYNRIADSNIMESMRDIAGLEKGASLEGVDLKKAATDYLTSIGLEEGQIQLLTEKLSK